MEIRELVLQHGNWFYLTAVVCTFLEGETIVLFAGFAAAQGLLNPAALVLACCAGSFAGDQCCFWLGRRFGGPLLDRFPRWHPRIDLALHWLERYDAGFILSFRFIYGVRNFSSFALGLSAVRWDRFLKLNFLAALIWAAAFVAFGYFLGHAWHAALGDFARTFGLAMLGALVVLALGVRLIHWAQRRRRMRLPAGAKPSAPLRPEPL